MTAVDECIFAFALRVSSPAFVHCAPASLRSREAAREGGYIEPFTFTLRLVCGTAKAVVYRSVAHAFSICTGHSRSNVQLGAQFTYLAWNKFGNGRFQRPIPPPHIHINRKNYLELCHPSGQYPVIYLVCPLSRRNHPHFPSLPSSLVFLSQCRIRAVTLIHSPFDDS